MPKRLLDDSYLSSPSLAKCSPRAQDAFPRFILMADDFGCFEAFPRVLLAKGWPYRTDVSEDDIWRWLEEYVAAGMACLWTEKERRWCYLTGWHGPHGQKVRAEYDPNAPKGTPGRHGSKRRTPVPPADLVAAVVAGERRVHDGKPPGTDRELTGSNEAEIVNDSTPAREVAVSRQSPGNFPPFPGPAVPVAVAVPVARSHIPARLVSGLGAADPYPATTAVLAALWDRGIDGAPPAERSAPRVEAAVLEAGVEQATERLAAVLSDPAAKRPLTYHVDAIRGASKRNGNVGDLGAEIVPWYTRLTDDEVRAYREERRTIAPDLDDAPVGILGPERELAVLNDRWRSRVEERA